MGENTDMSKFSTDLMIFEFVYIIICLVCLYCPMFIEINRILMFMKYVLIYQTIQLPW